MIERHTMFRRVDHRVTLGLTEDDRFEAVDTGYTNRRGETFLVNVVSWPARWSAAPVTPPDLNSRVTLAGLHYRKDGSLGQRKGTSDTTIGDLPEAVGKALLEAAEEVWQP